VQYPCKLDRQYPLFREGVVHITLCRSSASEYVHANPINFWPGDESLDQKKDEMEHAMAALWKRIAKCMDDVEDINEQAEEGNR